MNNMSHPFFKKKSHTFLFFFLLANLNALLNFSVLVSTELVEGHNPKILFHTIEELTGSYSFFSLVPLMLIIFKKFPLRKNKVVIRPPLYFFAAGCFGFLHTLIMYTTRSVIYDVFGWGTYEFGYMPYRILMESLKLLLGFWILYGGYVLFKISKERQDEKLRAIKLEEELSKTRLQILQSQIHPHFLFNTLNMISSTMYEDIHAADKMIADLSDLLRFTLKSSGKGENRLENEIEILNLYINIMRARFKDNLEVEINRDNDTKEAIVPSFLFQPLVENSIKYGMEKLGYTTVKVSIKRQNEMLQIKIEDNGPGIQKEFSELLKNGVGLSNSIERLEKLYGYNYKFRWENITGGGLSLTIEIPYKEKANLK
jgi:two-component sensor histidine kinase